MLNKKMFLGTSVYIIYINGDVYSENGNRFLKKFDNSKGYLGVNLWDGQKSHRRYCHRLVAQSFLENPNNYPDVNHIDGDKLNNLVDNLEWCTRAHNMNHARDTGLFDRKIAQDKENRQKWLGVRIGTRIVTKVTDIRNSSGNYKVGVTCDCSHTFLMYYNDLKKNKHTFCKKCRPKSSYKKRNN